VVEQMMNNVPEQNRSKKKASLVGNRFLYSQWAVCLFVCYSYHGRPPCGADTSCSPAAGTILLYPPVNNKPHTDHHTTDIIFHLCGHFLEILQAAVNIFVFTNFKW